MTVVGPCLFPPPCNSTRNFWLELWIFQQLFLPGWGPKALNYPRVRFVAPGGKICCPSSVPWGFNPPQDAPPRSFSCQSKPLGVNELNESRDLTKGLVDSRQEAPFPGGTRTVLPGGAKHRKVRTFPPILGTGKRWKLLFFNIFLYFSSFLSPQESVVSICKALVLFTKPCLARRGGIFSGIFGG